MSESAITKKAIAKGFKKILKIKSFEKITIKDITNECGLNRQTFYYHFQDKYALVNWIYYNEAILIITKDLNFENWSEKVLELLTIMKKDKNFYQMTLKLGDNNEFDNYLFSVAKDIFEEMIEGLIKEAGIKETGIKSEKKTFIAEFIAYGVVGMIIDWAQNGMKQPPDEITKNIKDIIEASRMFAVSRYLSELAKE